MAHDPKRTLSRSLDGNSPFFGQFPYFWELCRGWAVEEYRGKFVIIDDHGRRTHGGKLADVGMVRNDGSVLVKLSAQSPWRRFCIQARRLDPAETAE